jgi:hypothetical protein
MRDAGDGVTGPFAPPQQQARPSSAGDAHREQLGTIPLVRDRLAVPAKSVQVDGDGLGGSVAALLDGLALGDAAGWRISGTWLTA